WLYEQVPEVRTPEQWTEDLALRFRSDLCSWTYGQYAGEMYGGPRCQDRKTGSTKSYFPPFQILFVLPLPSCSCVKIHFSRGLIIECLVWALMIIKLEIAGQGL